MTFSVLNAIVLIFVCMRMSLFSCFVGKIFAGVCVSMS